MKDDEKRGLLHRGTGVALVCTMMIVLFLLIGHSRERQAIKHPISESSKVIPSQDGVLKSERFTIAKDSYGWYTRNNNTNPPQCYYNVEIHSGGDVLPVLCESLEHYFPNGLEKN